MASPDSFRNDFTHLPILLFQKMRGWLRTGHWCAACHIVAADQTRGSTQAPPFSAIAKQPGFNDARLALYLLLPHPRMPDMSLSRSEAADFAAYIASQGR
jgi:mono/diheme cytochrome c family protein